MATSDSAAAPARHSVDRDIIVNIHRHFHCQFQGTAEQLRAERLLPHDKALPPGRKSVSWEDAHWRFKLVRTRAPGSTALFSEWRHEDWWRLYRWSKGTEAISFADARMAECREELKRLEQARSPAGARQANLRWNAKQDSTFQMFLASITSRRPGR